MKNAETALPNRKKGRRKWYILSAVIAALLIGLILFLIFGVRKTIYPEVKPTDEEKTVVMKLGDHEVSYDLYRYFFLGCKNLISGGDDAYFDGMDSAEAFRLIDGQARKELADFFAAFDMAKEIGVDLDGKDFSKTYRRLLAISMTGGEFDGTTYAGYKDEKTYRQALKENGMNDASFRLSVRSYAAEYAAAVAYNASVQYKKEDVNAFFLGEDGACITFAYIPFLNGETAADTQRRVDTAYAALLQKKDAGLDEYTNLCIQYTGGWIHPESIKRGFCIGRYDIKGDYSSLAKTAFSLKEGEIGEPVATPDGYYIVRRLPLDEEKLAAFDYDELATSYVANCFYRRLTEIGNALQDACQTTDFYAGLTTDNVRYTAD